MVSFLNQKSLRVICLVLVAALAVCFTACNDVIFAEIRQETKLTKSQILGEVSSIVRYKSRIYVQNGNVWYKEASQNAQGWTPCLKPAGVSYVNKLAADDKYIYAQTMTYVSDEDEGENIPTYRGLFYSEDGITWTAVQDYGAVIYSNYLTFNIFCTNAPKAENRKAYANINGTIYELGTSLTEVTDPRDVTAGTAASIRSAAYFDGDTVFSSAHSIVTNETATTDATKIYFSLSGYIYYSSDLSTWSAVATDTSTIYAMAVTSDYILCGTEKGLAHIQLTSDGVPTGVNPGFVTNASSTLSSYYQVFCVLAVNPSLSEYAGTLYASTTFDGSSSSTSATTNNVCLWAYYANRASWNRE